MDQALRDLEKINDPSWRLKAQRYGLPITLKVGDVINIGPSYTWRGDIYRDTWAGLPCPVKAVVVKLETWSISGQKVWAALPPPYAFCPDVVAYGRSKIVLGSSLQEPTC